MSRGSSFARHILGYIQKSKSVLVFPSEIIAVSWQRHIARETGFVERDRCISWDRFKERVFFGAETRKPANSLSRAVFVQTLLTENASEAAFQRIVPPEYAGNSTAYRSRVTQLLPGLDDLLRISGTELAAVLGSEMLADLNYLHQSYGSFLEEHELYEPSWGEKTCFSDGRAYIICFPELLEDYDDYREQMEASEDIAVDVFPNSQDSGGAETASTSEADDPANRQVFQDFREEFHALVRAIAVLLDTGVEAADIIITLAGYDELAPRLSYIADAYGVPLSPRKAQPLISYPSVAWLSTLSELISSGYSFASMRRLLRHPGLPWRKPAVAAALVSHGIEAGIAAGGKRRWKSLAAASEPGADRILAQLEEIAVASSMEELKQAIYRFLGEQLDTSVWDRIEEGAWQQAVQLLDDIDEGLRRFSSPQIPVFSFFLEQLTSRSYLAQDSAAAVAVYDYRVAAGMYAPHHFVVNLNSESSRVMRYRMPILRDDQSRELFSSPGDMSADFYEAYTLSGDSVSLSCSQSVYGRRTVAAPLFLDAPAGDMPEVTLRHRPTEPNGNWKAETLRMDKTQWSDFRQSTIAKKIFSEGMHVSPTALKSFTSCAMGYFWRLHEPEGEHMAPDTRSAREVGNAFHGLMQRMYERISEISGNKFLSAHIDTYLEEFTLLVRRMFGGERQKYAGNIPRIIQPYVSRRFLWAGENIIRNDCDIYDGFTIYGLEMKLEYRFETAEGKSIVMSGFADRILQDPGDMTLVIIDYKTGSPSRSIPSGGRVLGELANIIPRKTLRDESEIEALLAQAGTIEVRLPEPQLPAYSLMAPGEVSRLGYYSMRGSSGNLSGEYKSILDLTGDPELSNVLPIRHESVLSIMEAALVDEAARLANAVDSGDFRLPEDGCDSCMFSGLCRTNFHVR